MIKEIVTTKLLTSIEHDGKIVGLFFEHELPLLEYLYKKYGKENVHTNAIKTKDVVYVMSDKEWRRHVNRESNKSGGISKKLSNKS